MGERDVSADEGEVGSDLKREEDERFRRFETVVDRRDEAVDPITREGEQVVGRCYFLLV